MERRTFLKASCIACAGGLALTTLEACSTLPMYKAKLANGLIEVPESTFGDSNQIIVRNANLEFDVLLVKNNNTYHSLYMQCTHETSPLVATKTGLYCSMHGSAFNLQGQVTKEPATKSLRKFETTLSNNIITINTNKPVL